MVKRNFATSRYRYQVPGTARNLKLPGTWYRNTGCVGKTVLPQSANQAAAAAAAAAADNDVLGVSCWSSRDEFPWIRSYAPLFCTTFALEIAHKIHRALFMAAGCDKLNQQKVLDARCTIQGQVWISRLNPSMNSNSSIHSNCCANSSSSSLSCRLDRGCSIATGIIVEYASVRSHQLRSFHGSSRYYVCCVHPLSTVHCPLYVSKWFHSITITR